MPSAPTNADRLYAVAYSLIGQRLAPLPIIEVGCAYSVDTVHYDTFQCYIGGASAPTVSTEVMCRLLKSDPTFEEIDYPEKGCIIISPSGQGNGTFPHGHVGIVGKAWIMSNDSLAKKWLANYTPDHWFHYFHIVGGFPVLYFRKKD